MRGKGILIFAWNETHIMVDFHFTLKRLHLQFRSQNLFAKYQCIFYKRYRAQYTSIVTLYISKIALPYNSMTIMSREVENPMLTNSNTQRRCELNGDFTNGKHADTSYWHQIVEQLLWFTGKVTLPSNPISSELDISRCSIVKRAAAVQMKILIRL